MDCRRSGVCALAPMALDAAFALAAQCPKECAAFAALAREIGCALALERLDGNASALLAELRPDYVKISLKTLTDAYGLEAGCNLAQALCGMASALSIRTIAPEVEDELLREALADYGFDYAPGLMVEAPAALRH